MSSCAETPKWLRSAPLGEHRHCWGFTAEFPAGNRDIHITYQQPQLESQGGDGSLAIGIDWKFFKVAFPTHGRHQ